MQLPLQLAITLLAVVLPITGAQETTSCNPLNAKCPADPALASSFNTNFEGAGSLPSGWSAVSGNVGFNSNGANFVINKQGDSPTIQTTGYFFFGYCEVKMQAAGGTGIVSSIVMESDDLDEVDWEFLGGDTTQTQTNYFGKGNTASYNRAIFYPVNSPQTTVHTYAVNWTSSELTWIIDGVAVRTLNYGDAAGGSQFPQTPMRLKLGIWAGGDPTNGQGTIQWSGGPTDYSAAPFTMTVQSVSITNYSPGSSYSFGDETGNWQSIVVNGGTGINGGSSDPGSSSADPPSSTHAVSGSSAIHISTASSPMTTSTGGGVVASSAPPVILQSTIVAAASPNGTKPTNATGSMTLATQTGSHTASAPTTASLTPASGADLVSSKMSYAALFAFGVVMAAFF